MRQGTATKAAASFDVALRRWFEERRGVITAQVAYETVPWVRNAVDKIAYSVSENPFGVYQDGEKIADERTYGEIKALREVNMPALMNDLAGDLLLYGYSHWAYSGVQGYEVLRRLAALHIRYERDNNGTVYAVEYRRGTYVRRASLWQALDEGGMPYVWLPNRASDQGPGAPPVLAALKAADLLDAMSDYGRMFFDSGGAGPVLVEMPDFLTAQDSEKERVKSWFDQMVNRTKRAFNALPTGQAIKVHHLGRSIRELDMSNITPGKREEIAGAFGVPASLMFADAANYATAEIDKLNYHDYAVNPLAKVLYDALNKRWLNALGLSIRDEHERLQVYQSQELSRSEKLIYQLQAGVISQDEFREETGREPWRAEMGELREPGGNATRVQVEAAKTAQVEQASNPAEDDLKKWRVKAVKRWREGTAEKGRTFESEHINAAMKAAIVAQLEVAKDEDDINAAFDGAGVWSGYG